MTGWKLISIFEALEMVEIVSLVSAADFMFSNLSSNTEEQSWGATGSNCLHESAPLLHNTRLVEI
jgi:hypothetical protein